MAGHPPDSVMAYTPAEARAWGDLAQARRNRERGAQLSLIASAARGKSEDIKRMIRELLS